MGDVLTHERFNRPPVHQPYSRKRKGTISFRAAKAHREYYAWLNEPTKRASNHSNLGEKDWPFSFKRSELSEFNKNEFDLLDLRIQQILQEIRGKRRRDI